MTRPTIHGLQDLLHSDTEAALRGDGVDQPITTSAGPQSVTFEAAAGGGGLTAEASLSGLACPTFSAFEQILAATSVTALAAAAAKAGIHTGASVLDVAIDETKQALTEIALAVDPRLSSLLGDPSLPDGLTLPGDGASLTIDPKQKSFTFACAVSTGSGGWTIAKAFTIDDVGLTVTGTPSASPALALDAHTTIAGVQFELSAERTSGSVKKADGDDGGEKEGAEKGDAGPAWKFRGALAEGKTISLTALVQGLGSELSVPLPCFPDVTLDELAVSLDTGTQEFAFTSDAKALGAMELEIGGSDGRVLYTYHCPAATKVDIKALVSDVSKDLGAIVPPMTIGLVDAVYVTTGGAAAKTLFGLDLGAGIDLSRLAGLPLVGATLAAHKSLTLAYQILASSDAFTADEAKALQQRLGDAYATLPDAIAKGTNLRASLKLGEKTEDVALPISLDGNQVKADSTKSGSHWFKLQKSLGPLHFDQLGVQYKAGELEILLKASMALGGLSISLDGLGVSSSLADLAPTFHLDGLGVAYQAESLKIGGALLRSRESVGGADTVVYDGDVVFQLGKLSFHGIGSYAEYKGSPSLFMYAFVGVPLFGVPFFFVDGLSAGFGYNRALVVPDLDGVATFPFVAEALDPSSAPNTAKTTDLAATLTVELDKLGTATVPRLGAGFFAVGLKFSSFKLIHAFALLTFDLAGQFEMDVLGVADLKVPNDTVGGLRLADMRLVLKGSFAPSSGFIGLIAALDKSSYLLATDCVLTGGFALYAWFAGPHAGDFVVTAGGYHPSFQVPSHYPTVPRLGFNWKLLKKLEMKGEMYFALCSHAIMAGGMLGSTYGTSKVHASWGVGADFLISWRPYHYDIYAYCQISAGVGHLTARVGADLHLWGPGFGGKVRIKIVVVHVTISFGDQAGQYPLPSDWNDFKGAFVPDDPTTTCAIAVQSGLVRQLETTRDGATVPLYVVNPKEFVLTTDAFFPTNKAIVGTKEQDVPHTPCAVRPMGVSAAELVSQHTVTIEHETSGSQWSSWEHELAFTPLRKKAPSALWGAPTLADGHLVPPDPNEPGFVVAGGLDPVSGFQISPASPPTPGHTVDIERSLLQYDTYLAARDFGWQTLPGFTPSADDETKRRATLQATIASNDRRSKLLTALGYDPAEDVQIDPAALDASLVIAPQVA